MKLYKHQQEAVDEILFEAEVIGSKDIVLEAPTSFGKSLVIAELCKCLKGNVVVLVNIEPLIDQIAEHLDLLKVDYSILKAGRESEFNDGHRVHIVMSQTFYARVDNIDLEADYLIQDEVHREYKTDRTNAVIRKLKPKSRIGLTGTPYDQAGYKLNGAEYIRTITIPELEKDGYVTPVKYFVPKWSTDLGLEDLRMSGNDYSGSAIDEKFNTDNYMKNVVKSMDMMNAKNKKTLVFCNSIEQADMIARELSSAGYDAAAIHSKKPKDFNNTVLKAFKGTLEDKSNLFGYIGRINVKCLISVSKLNIGFSVKDIELGVMLRPTKVRSLFIQTVGRLIRPFEGKEFAEFLDLSGVTMEHGFHDEPYEAPEQGDKKSKLEAEARASASQIKHIVAEEPTEVTREAVVKSLEELKKKEKQINEMEMKDLSAIYEQSTEPRVIIEIAHRINELKTGSPYKQTTINWIAEEWEMEFEMNPEYKSRWIKALKTRARNIVRDGKKLASLKYFIGWLVESQDDGYSSSPR